MNFENTALVTHKFCMDGSTSALVFIAAGGKKENVYFTLPGHDSVDGLVRDLAETWEGNIIIADASISLDLAEKINKSNTNIRLFDHHTTAIPLNKFKWCEIEVENTRSGGKMLYDFLLKEADRFFIVGQYKDLVDAADDVDRWVWKNPHSENIVSLHDALEQDWFIDRFLDNPSVRLTEQEEYLVNVHTHKRDIFVDRKKETATYHQLVVDGKSVRVAVVEAGTQQSMLGNALCADPECAADVAVMVNAKSISFRGSANCPVDLSKVAKLHGGGGHTKAAGVGLNNVLGEDFTDFIFSKIKWE